MGNQSSVLRLMRNFKNVANAVKKRKGGDIFLGPTLIWISTDLRKLAPPTKKVAFIS